MSDKYRIATVPINPEGEEEVNAMIYDTENSIDFEIPENEFYALFDNGVFNEINMRTDLLIDDYEEEVIPNSALQVCNQIINKRGIYKNGEFAHAIRTAMNYGTFVDLSF